MVPAGERALEDQGNLECREGPERQRWSQRAERVLKDGGLSVRSLRGLLGAEWAGETQVVPQPFKPQRRLPHWPGFFSFPHLLISIGPTEMEGAKENRELGWKGRGSPKDGGPGPGPQEAPQGQVYGKPQGLSLIDPQIAEDPSPPCQADVSFLTPDLPPTPQKPFSCSLLPVTSPNSSLPGT